MTQLRSGWPGVDLGGKLSKPIGQLTGPGLAGCRAGWETPAAKTGGQQRRPCLRFDRLDPISCINLVDDVSGRPLMDKPGIEQTIPDSTRKTWFWQGGRRRGRRSEGVASACFIVILIYF